MDYGSIVRRQFTELQEVTDESLRNQIVKVWTKALRESSFESPDDLPWWPPRQNNIGQDETTTSHVHDVTRCAIAIADALATHSDVDVDRNLVIAGSLLHDVSKVYEVTQDGTTLLQELVPHPHYSIHLLASAGCSLHLQHIVLSHSNSSSVEPKTLEAKIVQAADELVVEGAYAQGAGLLVDPSA
ncbi:HD domain-containing protein [Natronosalvus caseinilyticus]|uniref:HD domain-containing protein n=1 Tax=Natronosalvus caseinilyticus TaxID=2953747 RepID=UPI0028B0C703|nr:HD domain-containing protein [Natronosalvus caseinilyticus]